jgi:hypothetical protein
MYSIDARLDPRLVLAGAAAAVTVGTLLMRRCKDASLADHPPTDRLAVPERRVVLIIDAAAVKPTL